MKRFLYLLAKPWTLFTRAVGVWATRRMRPGRELGAALSEAAALRDRLLVAETELANMRRELERVQTMFRSQLLGQEPGPS